MSSIQDKVPKKEWWQIEAIPINAWDHIGTSFRSSQSILEEAFVIGAEIIEVEVGKWPKPRNSRHFLNLAYSHMISLKDEIRDRITKKEIDEFLLFIWGEYQKSVASCEGAISSIKQRTAKGGISDKTIYKHVAREWYVLWYEWCIENYPEAVKSRAVFDRFFKRTLSEIQNGQREIPKMTTTREMKKIIAAYQRKKGSKLVMTFTDFFSKDFVGAEFEVTRSIAFKHKDILPSVGMEFYPKKCFK